MYFFCYAGSWRSAVISICLTLLCHTELQSLKLFWQSSRSRHQRARDQLLLVCIVSVAALALATFLWLRRAQVQQWWQRFVAEILPQDDTDQHVRLSSQEVETLMGRLHALPIEPWRSAESLTSRELRQKLERFGLCAQLERREAVAAIEERTDTVCAVCQEEFCDGDPLRCLQQCRHSYHVECIDKWVCVETGKGRLPKCPLCNSSL
ncbi:hypothetical protein AB1Y20_022878 [Prymnesium parvum]|uniref:RING-type domain-containing protein n=1 Tax=Prymnesium parvum TaxID=97485 RepID=A0AB34JF04_PRYPA